MRKSKKPPIRYYGIEFDSPIEARWYLLLRERRDKGEIRDLVPHPSFDVTVPGGRPRIYTADAQYFDVALQQTVVDEVKPPKGKSLTRDFRIKMEQAQSTRLDWLFRVVTMDERTGTVTIKNTVSKAALKRLRQARAEAVPLPGFTV